MTLFHADFWRSIGLALARTFIAGVVPFVPMLVENQPGAWLLAGSTVGLLLIVTVATSLKGIPDPSGAPWWQILASRGLRQFGQYVAAATVTAVLLTDVNWVAVLQGAGASAASTVLLAALTLLPTTTAEVVLVEEAPRRAVESEA